MMQEKTTTRRTVSRGRAKRETYSKRFEIKVKPTQFQRAELYAEKADLEKADIYREGASIFMSSRLPILGTIPCGPLAEAVMLTDYYEIVPPRMMPQAHLGDYLLEASGDSMSPKIESGDLVMMRPGIEWGNGDICAVQVFQDKNFEGNCEATLKRLFWQEGHHKIELRAINPEYPSQIVEAEYLRVVGVFRGLLRQGRSSGSYSEALIPIKKSVRVAPRQIHGF